MAINPSISLGVQPPVIAPLQLQNPLEQFAKVQTLRNLMTQGQIGQMNLEQTQLENQALQEKQRRTNAVADLFTKGRPTEDQMLAVGGPEAAVALKGLHDSDKAKFDVLEATNKAITRTALGIKALPPEKRDFAYRAERARLLSANPALANQMPEQYDESYVDSKIQEGTTADQYFANVRADAKAKLEAPGVEAENQRKMAEAEQKQRQVEVSRLAPALKRGAVAYQQALAEMDPKRAALYGSFRDPFELYAFGTTPHEQITAQQAAANATRQAVPNTPTELAIWMNDPKRTPEEKAGGQAAMRELERHAAASRPVINNLLPGLPAVGAGGADQTTGEEFLKTLSPSVAAQIRGMAAGAVTAPSASSRAPGAQQLRDALFRYDPAFSEQRAQVRKSFLTGTEAPGIGKVNTAIVHLGRLGDAAESLQNGSFVPGNEAFNWLRDKFGSEKVTNFGLLKDAVAGEMAAALKGNATDVEIEKMGKSIRAANSPNQMRGVIQEGMSILKDKANTFDERYHAILPDDPWSPILPSAKEQLVRHSVKADGGPKTETKASGQYKAGDTRVINGNTYTRDANGNWK